MKITKIPMWQLLSLGAFFNILCGISIGMTWTVLDKTNDIALGVILSLVSMFLGCACDFVVRNEPLVFPLTRVGRTKLALARILAPVPLMLFVVANAATVNVPQLLSIGAIGGLFLGINHALMSGFEEQSRIHDNLLEAAKASLKTARADIKSGCESLEQLSNSFGWLNSLSSNNETRARIALLQSATRLIASSNKALSATTSYLQQCFDGAEEFCLGAEFKPTIEDLKPLHTDMQESQDKVSALQGRLNQILQNASATAPEGRADLSHTMSSPTQRELVAASATRLLPSNHLNN